MFSFNIHNHSFSHVHFIGIGGISMSGLAEILIENGYRVSGSDMKPSSILKKLESKGAVVNIGHNKDNIGDADLVVYTDAISKDNPELLEAFNKNITTVDRGTFLGQLMKLYKNSIAVSGTHGKTTTTGMMSVIFNDSLLDPTILLGGELDQIGGNVKIGNGEVLLTEACEYKGNILKFHATIGVILNIDADHLDYYKDLTHIINTFSDFVKLIPKGGYIVANNDDKNVREAVKNAKCNVVTFGIDNDSNYKATDITFNNRGLPSFKLMVNNEEAYDISLSTIGIHNVYNALAAIATAHICKVPMDSIIDSIAKYTGTHRRQEYKGKLGEAIIIDDYAHHPTAIRATLSALRNSSKGKIICAFQPHTYTRTKALLKEFADSFSDADKVIIADIYAAREKDTGMIHSRDLVNELVKNGVDAEYLGTFEEISNYIRNNASKDDIIVTMGAGDIYIVGEMLLTNK
ncbi:UDP-N-acetylmuramate--L-alanine ligase [Proteiniborus sp. MB09-C3]|uniref:UDP-N-acetylmuramate--L-alanine ligase n=1 Tax=Proteiniborus sp. MB09-C3 TaxID=3050072 RepID=UPI002555D73C|nr:UDP-N-acetylmuramate--L-alanine ligase [Proteiniborus sp. MB09-C3]WIV13034.1 UDP-N-acetylmuramate--L-alanine ligase [Proteiniborus sp. MB09-C3]